MNHEQAQALLPWHVAATLEADETEAVAGHALGCEECSADIRLFTGVRGVTAEAQAGEPVYRPQLLDNVMAQLSSVPQDAVAIQPALLAEPSPTSAGQGYAAWFSTKLREFVELLDWATTPVAAKWVMGAQCALLIGLLGMFMAGDKTEVDQGYVTVAGPTAPASAADFVIAFKPGIAEAEMRQILLQSDASLVAGPNAVGLYRIALPTQADRAAVERDLRASEWIIYLETVDKQ